jgi:predicted  nucleic acid-binding Zn-ribbon protein
MTATSINIQPINSASEIHNKREKELSYVKSELSPLNEHYETDRISYRLEDIKAKYTRTTGQQFQKKATPIREGVIVINSDTTMEHLKDFAQKCEQRFGIKAFQIHIHRDEGHMKAKDWKPNLHAHMVFDWTDKGGRSIKLNRQDMVEMQTILADSLQMERGVSSDKKHLTALQFKTEAEQNNLIELKQDLELKEQQVLAIKAEINNIEVKKHAISALSKGLEKLGDAVGLSKNDKEKESLKTALNEAQLTIEHQKIKLSRKDADNESLSKKISVLHQASQENKELKEVQTKAIKMQTQIQSDLAEMFKPSDARQWEKIQTNWPIIYQVAQQGIKDKEIQEQKSQSTERKKGFRMGM